MNGIVARPSDYRGCGAASGGRDTVRVKQTRELFGFVADPSVPTTNNAAERSLRHLVTCRKISGGTRGPAGTASKMALATLFGTWRAQGLHPLDQCRRLLANPQV